VVARDGLVEHRVARRGGCAPHNARRSQKVAGHRRRGLKRRLNKHRCLISYLVTRPPEAALQGVVFWRTVVDDHSALAL
jgi:hypothetical protein